MARVQQPDRSRALAHDRAAARRQRIARRAYCRRATERACRPHRGGDAGELEARLAGALRRRPHYTGRGGVFGAREGAWALTTLFDIFGYVGVVLHGLDLVAQTLLIGGVAFALWIAAPLEDSGDRDTRSIVADTRRVIALAALAAAITALASTTLNALVLSASIGASLPQVVGATFVVAGAVK